ncbi:MAG TPA: N-acetylglucosamine/diacetylchitobiose ABC transporter substrate-binding protein [Actinophytocola sp.]|uniref:N-acetylglucosamine/diacetylchitobiose ABC transporter substrate-binding protein n=1 Tax=Actinophytocola sp. TaxID=1872138 RepID=UPI002DDC91A5|nr:N-acetylglucosamine/diacetylchitobiose ABC transporter substrate-binding protein [Actinophytocola sp.]HEV2782371.1 N-acetylglucosamine/diacetylchitobiose ABC transporter substrate-binding protein [Actinophytocola sp.]
MSESIRDTTDLSRRRMLRGIGLAAFLAVPGAGVLSACATGGESESPPASGPANTGNAENPFGVKADAPLEVVIFTGGLGETYATEGHEPLYKKKFPNATIKHVGTQQISQQLQPRFAAGDPPDFIANSGTNLMDNTALVEDSQLLDLTPLLEAPSIDDPSKKIKDTLLPGTIEPGLVNGKPYVLNYVSIGYGLWYDKNLFAKNSWTPPKTFDEFKALAEKMKSAGIIPYSYAGANASYYQYWMIMISAAKIGGNEVIVALDNLDDGAWTAEPVRKSAAAWAEIIQTYGDKAHEGLKHTEVQTLQNQGKVGLYPSGSWLENEQKKETPATFEYAMAPTPSVTSSDKMPYEAIRTVAGEGYIIPAKGKNTAGALEYMRIMLSKEGAKVFYEKSGNLTVVKGAADGVSLSPGNKSVADAVSKAGDNLVTFSNIESWWKDLEKELRTQTNALMFGRITADQFCENMENKAKQTKNDPAIPKQHRDK